MGNVKKAARYYLFRERVNISKRVNWFLFFLRRIPWLGKKISPHVYQAYSFKTIFFFIVAVVSVIFSILVKGLAIGGSAGMVWLFDLIIHHGESGLGISEYLLSGLFLWFILTAAINVYNIWFSQVEPKTLEFMENFHLSKKFFTKAYLLIYTLINGIYYIVIAGLIAWLLDAWILALAIPLLYLTLGYLCYYLARVILSKNRIPLMTQAIITIIGILIAFAIGVVLPIFTGVSWISNIIFSSITIIIAIMISVVSFIGIHNFKREDEYLSSVLERSTLISEGAKNIHTHTAANVQKKMMVTDSVGRFENKKGNSYLNALLFDRYQKMFRKIILIRLAITGVMIVATLAAALFLTDVFDEAELVLIPMLNIIIIPVWISMFSVGRKVIQIVFVNCDSALLNYPFYRKKEVILSGFFERLKKTFLLNSVLIIAPLVMALIIGFNNDMNFSFVWVMAVILISLLTLFSFHELFLYYILQPFATDMQVKSPLYTIITIAISMVIWGIVGGGFGGGTDLMEMLSGSQWQIAIILVGITVIYMLLGTFSLYKFGSKTFKAKS